MMLVAVPMLVGHPPHPAGAAKAGPAGAPPGHTVSLLGGRGPLPGPGLGPADAVAPLQQLGSGELTERDLWAGEAAVRVSGRWGAAAAPRRLLFVLHMWGGGSLY